MCLVAPYYADFSYYTGRQCFRLAKISQGSVFNPTKPVFRKHLVIGQLSLFNFFSAFHWSPSIGDLVCLRYPSSRLRNHTRFHWSQSVGKPRLTPVSSGYGIIRGLPMKYTMFADWVTHLGTTFSGTDRPNYCIGPNPAGCA